MSQRTISLSLSQADQRRLIEELERSDYEFRSVPHAQLSVRDSGVVATLYRSGKLVIQGPAAEAFQLRHLASLSAPEAPAASNDGEALLCPVGLPLVGSDECGKGDYFGPLVVCALRVPAEERASLAASEVCDSKKLSDKKVLRLSAGLAATYEHALESLEPAAYNEEYQRTKNLNPMLAELHARAIRRLARPGDVVLVDRFGREDLVGDRLQELEIDLHQEVRAEREPAVAAASILARAHFLQALGQASERYGLELRKGAGSPVDQAGLDFVHQEGPEALSQVAKLHFKNTEKILTLHGS